MRRTLILTLAVLAIALALCWGSRLALNDAVDRAEALRGQALLAHDESRSADALALMTRLAEFWQSRSALLETVASHDALHDVQAAIAEARICLECDDHDDFLRTLSTVRLGLEHLKDEAALSWKNLY